MFDMSADDMGWLITLILAIALVGIVIGAGLFWR
jgi:hypothetical protein